MEEGGGEVVPNQQVMFGGPGGHSVSSAKIKLAIGGGIFLFVIVLTAVIIVDSVHTIEEGNVGIYFVQGALDDTYTMPGVHWSVPFVTVIQEITIRPQTETLDVITTVTRDGITNTFNNIQVLSNVEVQQMIPLIKKIWHGFQKGPCL